MKIDFYTQRAPKSKDTEIGFRDNIFVCDFTRNVNDKKRGLTVPPICTFSK